MGIFVRNMVGLREVQYNEQSQNFEGKLKKGFKKKLTYLRKTHNFRDWVKLRASR